MNAIHDDEDQRIQMQQSARAFLRRNPCEHHGNDQLLFSRTVQYRTEAFDIPLCIAEKRVAHAYGDLKDLNDRRRLDVTARSRNLEVTHFTSGDVMLLSKDLLLPQVPTHHPPTRFFSRARRPPQHRRTSTSEATRQGSGLEWGQDHAHC